MTFNSGAWAIDGARLTSSLAREQTYQATSGAEGISQSSHLKVTALAVPGAAIDIAPGGGLILNGYQTVPDQTYGISNPSTHTLAGPAADPAPKSYIVAVTIGDPEFSQVGHPWMTGSDPAPGTEADFVYVRPILIPVANSSVTTLDVPYPALPLARIDIPENTTTILNSYITDLRQLAQPRQSQVAYVSPSGAWSNASPRYIPSGAAYADWGRQEFATDSVRIPVWAKRAIVIASINGVRFKDTTVNIAGGLRTELGGVAGPATSFDYEIDNNAGVRRVNLQTAGEYDVSGIAGQTVIMRVQGFQNAPASPSNDQRLRLQSGSQQIFDVRFFEE